MIVVTYFRSSGRSGLLYKQITCAGPDISSGRLPSDHKNRLQILIVLTEVAVGLWSSRGVWQCDSVTVWQCDSVRVLPARDNWELRQPLQWAAPPVCRSWPSVCPCVSTRPHRPGPATGSLPGSEDEREGGGRREEGGGRRGSKELEFNILHNILILSLTVKFFKASRWREARRVCYFEERAGLSNKHQTPILFFSMCLSVVFYLPMLPGTL